MYRKQTALIGIVPAETPTRVRDLFDVEAERWGRAANPREMAADERPLHKEKFESLMRDAVLRQGYTDMFRIGWINSLPISAAMYFPARNTLLLHEWLLEHSRPCDAVACHAWNMAMLTRRSMLRCPCPRATLKDARCDARASPTRSGSPRASIEWKHASRTGRGRHLSTLNVGPAGGGAASASTPEAIWTALDAGNSFRHFVPFEDETLRCAALPAQSLGYVIHPTAQPRRMLSQCRVM